MDTVSEDAGEGQQPRHSAASRDLGENRPRPAEPVAFQRETSVVQMMLESRRMRTQVFDPAMFGGEAAWDILLLLYDADLCRRQHTPESLASAIGLPQSTTSRWLQFLEQSGLVCSADSVSAVRLSVLILTDGARNRLFRYFDKVAATVQSCRSQPDT